jgi:hypothetical protein
MCNQVLIITRNDAGEWKELWGFDIYSKSKSFMPNGVESDKFKDGHLIVRDGRDLDEDAFASLKCVYSCGVIAVHGNGQLESIRNQFGCPCAAYSLGNNNNNPDELGKHIRDLATAVGNKVDISELLGLLRSAMGTNSRRQAMGSLMTCLAPLALVNDPNIQEGVIGSLNQLCELDKKILAKYFVDIGTTMQNVSLCFDSSTPDWSELLKSAVDDKLCLDGLARRFL